MATRLAASPGVCCRQHEPVTPRGTVGGMGSWGHDTFDSDDADTVRARVFEQLEMELVFFLHRVGRGQAEGYQAARAAMALLGALVRGGVTWQPEADVGPAAIARSFTRALDLMAADPVLRAAILADVEAFVRTTGGLPVSSLALDPIRAASLVRRAGGSAALYRDLGSIDVTRAWDHVRTAAHLVELAACAGVPVGAIAAVVHDEVAAAVPAIATERPAWRRLLVTVGAGDRAPLTRATLATAYTAALEQRRATWRSGAVEDPLAEWVIIATQWLVLADAADPSPHAAGELAHRTDRALTELDRPLTPALRTRLAADYRRSLEAA